MDDYVAEQLKFVKNYGVLKWLKFSVYFKVATLCSIEN